MRRAVKSEPLDSVRQQIRAAGLRSTKARVSVMQELIGAASPLSHAEVATRLDSQGFDRATIYRNLVELAEAGLVSRVELGDHVWRFEMRRAEGESGGDHAHFLCVDCGEVSCLPTDSISIKQAAGAKQSPIREVTEVLLKGRCGNCA